jgi:hypothetical protein
MQTTREERMRMTNEEAREHNRKVGLLMAEWDAKKGQGYVYFLRAGNTVKIGFSKNLQGRLEKLRNGNSFPVFICKFVNGDRKTERSFHKRFAEYRLRGEWFDLRGSLAKYLEMHFRPIGLPPPLNDPEPEWDIIL